jgi:ribonuclease BN (tRNA processing enzyme)
MRLCKKCGLEKDDDCFIKRKDGFKVYTCRDCVNKRYRELRSLSPQQYRDRTNNWLKNNEKQKEVRRLYRLEHPEIYRANSKKHYELNKHNRNKDYLKEYNKNYRKNNPEKSKAQHHVNYNKSIGKLKELPCEICGCSPTDAHHDDYSKPLEVMWLCRKHHAEYHKS